MYIGLDIGGTKILGGLFDGTKVIKTKKLKTKAEESQDDIYGRIVEVINFLARDIKIEGIGIGIPGSINNGTVLISPNLPFKNFPLKEKLFNAYQIPIAMDNDVNVGLLGEHWAGAAKGLNHVIGIFIGTGIGGAIIINNSLLRGKHNIAGEIGHMKLKLNGPRCNCGEKGCFEILASKQAFKRQLEKYGFTVGPVLKSSLIKTYIDDNNKNVKNITKKISAYIGEAIGSLVNILDPEAIILGGGVIEAVGDYMLRKITPIAEQRALCKPDIRLSKLGDYALIYGGVRLVQTQQGII